jgi:hypothetical protein
VVEGKQGWVPADIDLNRPNAARIYDYVLGGANNFGVDREFAKQLLAMLPDAQVQAQQNRSFLRRAVTFLASAGIRQFLDLGSGIPTVGNTHEVAQRVAPDARVLYVDNEPVAVAHSEMLLEHNPTADVVRADLTDPDSVLGHPKTRALLDFEAPIAVLMFAVMHFVPDSEDPVSLVGRYRDAGAPGSYLAMSHATADGRPEMAELVRRYRQTANPVTLRSRDEVVRLFAGYELVEPGVVFGSAWRAEIEPLPNEKESVLYGGVGRKR